MILFQRFLSLSCIMLPYWGSTQRHSFHVQRDRTFVELVLSLCFSGISMDPLFLSSFSF